MAVAHVWVNRAGTRWHAELGCSGLAHLPIRTSDGGGSSSVPLDEVAFADVAELVQHPGRPCRICALERAAHLVLTHADPGRRRLVTFTGQCAPDDENARPVEVITDRAAARLERIAQRGGLTWTHTKIGPAAVVSAGPRTRAFLARNFRSLELPAGHDPTTVYLGIVWALADEIDEDVDLFELAIRLARP